MSSPLEDMRDLQYLSLLTSPLLHTLWAKFVQSEATVERGYWQQKRLMNPLRSRRQQIEYSAKCTLEANASLTKLGNDSIRDEMRILLNGESCAWHCFQRMQCSSCRFVPAS